MEIRISMEISSFLLISFLFPFLSGTLLFCFLRICTIVTQCLNQARARTWADIRIFPPSHLILDHLVEIHYIYWYQESFHSQTGGGDSDITDSNNCSRFQRASCRSRGTRRRDTTPSRPRSPRKTESVPSWDIRKLPPPSCDTILFCEGRGDLDGTHSRR